MSFLFIAHFKNKKIPVSELNSPKSRHDTSDFDSIHVIKLVNTLLLRSLLFLLLKLICSFPRILGFGIWPAPLDGPPVAIKEGKGLYQNTEMRVQALGLDLDWDLKTLINLKILIHLHSLLKVYLKGYKTPKLKTEEQDVNRRYSDRQDTRYKNKKLLSINHFALCSLLCRAMVIFHPQTQKLGSVSS